MDNEKIIQVKKLLHDYEDYETKGVYSCDYNELAQEIVKLFAIPNLVGQSKLLVCDVCEGTGYFSIGVKSKQCPICKGKGETN